MIRSTMDGEFTTNVALLEELQSEINTRKHYLRRKEDERTTLMETVFKQLENKLPANKLVVTPDNKKMILKKLVSIRCEAYIELKIEVISVNFQYAHNVMGVSLDEYLTWKVIDADYHEHDES